MRFRASLLILTLVTTLIAPANAIVNGTSAVGSDYVITILFGESKPQGFCTGAYLRPRVVITAAHCVIKDGARAPELRRPLSEFYVSQTGVDWSTQEAKDTRVRVLKIWTVPEYFNRFEPDKGFLETQVDDVAFLFLEKELKGAPLSRPATKEEIEQYRLGSTSAFHLGYGCINTPENKIISNDGKPYLVEGIVGTQGQATHIPNKDRFLSVLYPAGKSLCPGDSGSPLLMKKGNEVLYLATLFAGGGWSEITAGDTNYRGVASATVLWPFIPTLDNEWEKFLKEEQEIIAADLAKKLEIEKAAQELKAIREAAIANNTYYQDKTACHSRGINAEIQEFSNGVWKSAATSMGWDEISSCPITHPVQPWTIAEFPAGTILRWRFWMPGQFDVNSPQFNSLVKPTPTFSPTPSLTPTPTPAPSKSIQNEIKVLTKKTTITCVKGKLVKKMKAVNPKCPKGYKKK